MGSSSMKSPGDITPGKSHMGDRHGHQAMPLKVKAAGELPSHMARSEAEALVFFWVFLFCFFLFLRHSVQFTFKRALCSGRICF